MMSFDWIEQAFHVASDFMPALGVIWALIWGGAKASLTLNSLRDDVNSLRLVIGGLSDRVARLEGSIGTHLNTGHAD